MLRKLTLEQEYVRKPTYNSPHGYKMVHAQPSRGYKALYMHADYPSEPLDP